MNRICLFLILCFIFFPCVMAQDLSEDDEVEVDATDDYVCYGEKWNKTNLKFYLNNNSTHLTAQERESAINYALSQWADVSEFTFQRVYNEANADIRIKWDYDFQSNSTLGQTISTYDTNTLINAYVDIHFNDNINWVIGASNNGYNLLHVATHELGHALALDHSSDPNAMMYPTYHSSSLLNADDVCGIWAQYGFPFLIKGPTVISQSGEYYIENFPNLTNLSVVWSISNSYYNQNNMYQNTPLTNECTITRASQDMSNETLTAIVKYYGTTEHIVTKSGVYAHAGFKGTYYNGVTTKQVNLPYPMYVKRNANLSLQSPNLINATVTHEGDATVSSFSFNSTTGTVNFYLTSLGTCVVKVYCDNGDMYGLPFIVTDNLNQLNMVVGDGQIEVSLMPVENEEMRNLGSDNLVNDLTKGEMAVWTLEVYNATTGEKVFGKEIEGTSFTIDTTGWKPGVYVVRAIIGDEVLNEKVIVK